MLVRSYIHIIYGICFVLELVELICLVAALDSSCFLAGEITLNVNIFMFLFNFALLLDMNFVIGMFSCCGLYTLGLDPTAAMFNVCAGVLNLVCGVAGFMTVFDSCQNPARHAIGVAGVLALLSSIGHFINFGLTHNQLEEDDQYILTCGCLCGAVEPKSREL